MTSYSIVIGADHRGFEMKEYVKLHLIVPNYSVSWIDVGAYTPERSDYPPFAVHAAQAIIDKKADYGILLCGSGIGMAIVANRFNGIYAGLVWNSEIARLSREDDNTNMLVLPSDFITNSDAIEIITSWLTAEFKCGRYQYRIDMIDKIRVQ